MATITSNLLRAMVPRSKGQQIDRLIGPLNLVLPAYDITTELRVAAFLATAAPESDWFKTLREYGKGAGRAYGRPDRVTGLVYYGRGIFQNTWKKGYAGFTKYVKENWSEIQPRATIYGYSTPPDFVYDPELLATHYWAVEAACWYWLANGLQTHADRGLRGFFGLQGLVNRGSAKKEALHYPARLNSYEKARRLLPDDFILDGAEQSAAGTPESEDPNETLQNPLTTMNVSESLTPTAETSTALSSASTQPLSTTIFERMSGWQSKIEQVTSFGNTLSVSTGSWWSQFTTRIGGWGMMLLGVFTNNPIYLVLGIVLIGLAVWYLTRSKDRATARATAIIAPPAPTQTQTVNVEGT